MAGALVPAAAVPPPPVEAQPSARCGPTRRSAAPVRLRIPAVRIDTALQRLGRAADRTVEVPTDFGVAGWFADGPRPGQNGPAVILGHVDSRNGPGVFYPLAGLAPGSEVLVDRADGTTAAFRVNGVATVPKTGFPTEQVYGPTLRSSLRLVTCGGPFDHAAGSYRDNVIVSADPVAVGPRALLVLAAVLPASRPRRAPPRSRRSRPSQPVRRRPGPAGRAGARRPVAARSRRRLGDGVPQQARAEPVLSDRLGDGARRRRVGRRGARCCRSASRVPRTSCSRHRRRRAARWSPTPRRRPSRCPGRRTGGHAARPERRAVRGGAQHVRRARPGRRPAAGRRDGPRLVVLYTGAADAGGEPAASARRADAGGRCGAGRGQPAGEPRPASTQFWTAVAEGTGGMAVTVRAVGRHRRVRPGTAALGTRYLLTFPRPRGSRPPSRCGSTRRAAPCRPRRP